MKTKIKNLWLLFAAALLIFSCKDIGTIGNAKDAFECGQMIDFEKRMETDKSFKAGLEKLEAETNRYLENLRKDGFADFRSTVVTIPVVVHVVYKNATENISMAKIQSQIDALNSFFRRTNADVATVPSPFQGLVADAMIEFELAKRDPNCAPTNGVTRTPTTIPSFTNSPGAGSPTQRNPVKFTASGGQNGWPSDQYLNLWSCDLAGGLIGYASFPSDLATRPAEDGVVMDFMAVGTVSPIFASLNLGRVCGHEVGHWLNLRHIWGDDGNACTGTDFVADTPNQAGPTNGCPSFPKTDACSPSSPGIMFMNQMDYTTDACRTMFTNGQADRMHATLFTVRASILGSQGAIPPPAGAGSDLWAKDTDDDLGNEPNNASNRMYKSDDIWVRRNNDGLTNQESQSANGSQTNFVYVRVRNRGCQPFSGAANLRLYWAKASGGLSWPTPWDGSVPVPASPVTLMGDAIGTQLISSVAANGFTIFTFQWNNTPDPSDYNSLGPDLNHFCLLARIEESGGMASPEIAGDLWGNVKRNNNIVWKNIAIDDTDGPMFTSTLISNYTKGTAEYDITIDGRTFNKGLHQYQIPGRLYARFDERLQKLIEGNRVMVNGLQQVEKGKYEVLEDQASIKGLKMRTMQHHVVSLKFEPSEKYTFQRFVYKVNLEQIDTQTGKAIGGQLFKFKTDRTR